MNERDPVGDKIRLKERAEEDQYFAAQDRELIAKLHHTQALEQEHTIEELARHRCAECGTRLEQRRFQTVSIDECPACHGVWLDHAALMALAKRDTGAWVASFLDGLVRVVAHPKDQALLSPTLPLTSTCLMETRTALLGMLCKSRYVRLDEPGEVSIPQSDCLEVSAGIADNLFVLRECRIDPHF